MTASVSGARTRRRRSFYVTVAFVLAMVVLVGFAPTYYLRDSGLGPLKPVLAVHGAVFTVWLGIFLAQPLLVWAGRTDLHRKLGWFAAAWAALMVVLGVAAGLDTLRNGVAPVGADIRQFAMLPFGDIAIFAGLVGAAVWLRRRPEWHKRLMVMSAVSLLTPAIARFPMVLTSPMAPIIFLGATAAAAAAVIAFDWAAHGKPHPANLIGGAIVGLGKPVLLFAVAVSPPWLALMDALKG